MDSFIHTSHPRLLERMRARPSASTVEGSLPVLFFGDLFSARIATVGLNPSDQEFLSRDGVELDGAKRRFETLGSLGAADRASLSDADCERAVERMRGYFRPGKPVYSWFNSYARVVDGFGASFSQGSAVHLDLVQEATSPVWSQMKNKLEAGSLLKQDLPFLKWQIESFPLAAVLCTSVRVLKEVTAMTEARLVKSGQMARLKWEVRVATLGRGKVGIAGWNYPLARPTGLDRAGHVSLGRMLADELARAGCSI